MTSASACCLFAFAVAFPAVAAAELARAATLRGAFVETPGNAPLAAVEVVLRRVADSTVVAHTLSAADGRFAFESLPLGAYLFRASLLGHVSLTRSDIVLTELSPALDLGTLSLAVSALDVPGITTSTERATTIVASDRNIYPTIEVIADPSAKFDPEGTAGIVNIVLKDDVDLGLSGSVSLTAGQRYSGPGARIAWQKGPLTLFGGLSANMGSSEYRYAKWR